MPHKQNDGVWPSESPHWLVENNNCNNEKGTIFVAIVEEKVIIVHSFVDENGSNVSVNWQLLSLSTKWGSMAHLSFVSDLIRLLVNAHCTNRS